jgi:hypothetical protein
VTYGLAPPTDWIGPTQSCGRPHRGPILADLAYRGADWQQLWATDYAAVVLTPLTGDRRHARLWFVSLRQAVETALANLCDSFGLHFPRSHTTWGLLTQIGAKIAAYNCDILLNRSLGRPDMAMATLIG